MDKKEIAEILEEIGVILDILGENPFKIRAYETASRALEASSADLDELIEKEELTKIKGVGKSIAEKIVRLRQSGKLPYYEDLKKKVPAGLLELVRIPGLGPKRTKVLYDKLNIKSIGELEYACMENRLVDLEGFGAKSQGKILEGVERVKKYKERFLFSEACDIAEKIEKTLSGDRNIIRSSVAGSIRRRRETVKDIDFLASAKNPQKAMDLFTGLPEVDHVTAKGETKSSVIFKNGIASDLRIVSDKQFPYALHHFTGSKEHNIAMRTRAKRLNLQMNEYGLFRGKKNIPCKNEEEIFKKLGLVFIPPELRENMGEIEAAEKGKLPALVEEKDLRGTFHVHTDMSDGTTSIEPLVEECRKLGWEFLGISDHSKSAAYAGGLSVDEIKKQHKEIDRLNSKLKCFKIYKGIESDILDDGSLDYPERILASFDFVIASVHSKFNMPEDKMTGRIIKALKNKFTTILGHPTGRLLLSREPYAVNMKDVIKAAADYGKVIELNANPYRLDIDWREMPGAKTAGVKIMICPDAHNPQGLYDIRFGVWTARKGWLEKKDVVNCLSTKELDSLLRS